MVNGTLAWNNLWQKKRSPEIFSGNANGKQYPSVGRGIQILGIFYNEESETGLLHCKPSFKLQVTARPTINNLSPFQAQRIINSCESGTFGTGKIFSKDVTQLLVEGNNQIWYRQKKSCIDHICLLGDGNKLHKEAMEAFRKEEIQKRRSTAASKIFRAGIVDLKLGGAARHFETMISFLSCCSVDV